MIVGILSGPLLKKYNYRQVAFVGVLIMWSGIFLTTFAKSYIAFIFTVGILQGMLSTFILLNYFT